MLRTSGSPSFPSHVFYGSPLTCKHSKSQPFCFDCHCTPNMQNHTQHVLYFKFVELVNESVRRFVFSYPKSGSRLTT